MTTVLDALVIDVVTPHRWAPAKLSALPKWVIVYDGRRASAADTDGNVIVPPTRIKSRWLWFMLPSHPTVTTSAFNWISSASINTIGGASGAIVVVVRNAGPAVYR